jgi:hypothetical protein
MVFFKAIKGTFQSVYFLTVIFLCTMVLGGEPLYTEEEANGILPACLNTMNYHTTWQSLLMSNLGVLHKINQIECAIGLELKY